jgi:adenylate kinase family enzyme
MNIVEKYIEINKQLIILISGFSGSGKTYLGKQIEKDLKIHFLNLNNYYKKDYNEIIDLGNNIKVVDWDNPESIDWNLFNDDVNKFKNNGVVISGFGFPNYKINFKTDYHIYIRISKEKLIKNRHEFLNNNKNEQKKLYIIKDTKTELLILNNMSFKHFMNIKDKSTYSTKIDVSDITLDLAYDNIFDYLMEQIQKNIYNQK